MLDSQLKNAIIACIDVSFNSVYVKKVLQKMVTSNLGI